MYHYPQARYRSLNISNAYRIGVWAVSTGLYLPIIKMLYRHATKSSKSKPLLRHWSASSQNIHFSSSISCSSRWRSGEIWYPAKQWIITDKPILSFNPFFDVWLLNLISYSTFSVLSELQGGSLAKGRLWQILRRWFIHHSKRKFLRSLYTCLFRFPIINILHISFFSVYVILGYSRCPTLPLMFSIYLLLFFYVLSFY